MRKILSLFLSLSLVFPLFVFIFTTPVLALNFNPAFGVTLSDNTPGANANLTITTTQPAGEAFPRSGTFHVPAGWDINFGTNIADGAVIGSGNLNFFHFGVPQSLSFTFENSTNTLGHKARWFFNLPEPFPDQFVEVDGNIASGHSFTLVAGISGLETPLDFTLNFSGQVGGTPVFTNPTTQGDYTWSVDYISFEGHAVSKSQTLSIPGSSTPAGTNVKVTFSGGAQVEFSSVTTSGTTTQATSTTPPPAGTGQFQLSGGLYYDFNTTATFSCPCIITLPYDPLTTPNPRIYHLENGVWVDVTTSVDTVNHTVTGVVSSFSFFAVGQPNFTLEWSENLTEKLTEANPFTIEADDEEDFDFTIFDSSGNSVTTGNVTVEVWQTHDATGNPITPVKTLSLTPEVDDESFESELDLDETPLGLGTYQVRVLVANTTVTQTPQTASFTVVERD